MASDVALHPPKMAGIAGYRLNEKSLSILAGMARAGILLASTLMVSDVALHPPKMAGIAGYRLNEKSLNILAGWHERAFCSLAR